MDTFASSTNPLRRLAASTAAVIAGLCLLFATPAQAARYQVCTFSFHNPEETAMFRASLPPDQFDIVDLSPEAFGVENGPIEQTDATPRAADPSKAWPQNLCRADLRCDILVIAGEFAGRFFGKNGRTLTLQEMDEAACQSRCNGLFHAPREVFMLACNTLATKDEDRRTPDEYRRVLLEHGFDAPAAERVVELRYGPMGQSFRESLRRVFTGVPRLYGFSSVAPVGQTTAPMLERYFRERGDYASYLEAAGRQPITNQLLLTAFRGTDLVQTTGLSPSESGYPDREKICAIYDDQRELTARLTIVRNLLDRPDLLSFLPTIHTFFTRHPPASFTGEARGLMDDVQHHAGARTQVLDLVAHLQTSALKLEIAHLANQLDWMSAADFRTLAINSARELLQRGLTSEVVDVMCTVTQHQPIGDAFTSADLSGLLFTHAEGLRLIDCLSPTGDDVSARLATALDSADPSMRVWAIYALSHRLPLNEPVLRTVVAHLNDPATDVREQMRALIRLQYAQQPSGLATMVRTYDPALAEQLEPCHKLFGC